ncbi:tetratricopeptide repeat protein 1-like isoform X1 [Homarus americanus]|uniref:tetratricopeptide repeat protein 1-like isoform X1 n=2 Tax=Homarus americanus TaxID=6706 RepID=UPI001C457008|nr:tetratricopeptide repeat protein 1-like isoform X1 [Homarus americanus]
MMEGLEKDMASASLCGKEEEEEEEMYEIKEKEDTSRSTTPDSDDSFHSLEDEDRGVPNCPSELRAPEETDESSEDSQSSNVPIIEPEDGSQSCDGHSDDKTTEAPCEQDQEKEQEQDQEQEQEQEKEQEQEDDEDSVDEEYLKDLELNLSEEEKSVKRDESLTQKESGNDSFRNGQFQEAVAAYTAGLRLCPLSYPKDRAILYSNRAAAKVKMDLKKEAISDCNKAVELHDTYTKAILRRATLNEETDNLDEALKDFRRVLELDPSHKESEEAVRRLPDMINERNEKLKEEMMGKLKDLGNVFLRPFGLSTSNFELQQDPNSGGYNISFKQNSPNS